MSTKIKEFEKEKERTDLPEINTGNTVRVTQEVNGKTQSFEGIVIAKKSEKSLPGTITVRSVMDKVGVERTFPLHSPLIKKIEVLRKGKTRRSKAYYLREKTKKETRRKIK